ncbi:hypothetical protein HCN44_007315 [Aphidius gifuensis]|uniref:Uncharacterized protein n=1 Tax=Aphidius gifuensis TaxID=684658 RepID=A0A834XPD9_APHGI|nr:hypothetical protein HCN44_007315 [Aphidius gifuensis]
MAFIEVQNLSNRCLTSSVFLREKKKKKKSNGKWWKRFVCVCVCIYCVNFYAGLFPILQFCRKKNLLILIKRVLKLVNINLNYIKFVLILERVFN